MGDGEWIFVVLAPTVPFHLHFVAERQLSLDSDISWVASGDMAFEPLISGLKAAARRRRLMPLYGTGFWLLDNAFCIQYWILDRSHLPYRLGLVVLPVTVLSRHSVHWHEIAWVRRYCGV